ncbi:pseudouridine synthase [Vibrio lentus]|uniref:YqcC family protein n=1 Tax=Vibrio TaxID=662 RepID=UPI0002E6AD17|nr:MULTISPECIES: YqcC family protein [Vibrio]MDN2667666.1 YqcC family protein [Vibrio sp. 14N.309.X.WAT.E.F5]OED66905.1 pseudouridine synthase [Vibrio tasmaniensis ZS-17]PMG45489.1 pseudouridine synthase [Vibrio lentus]PMI01124.1 pseudouridine synthase [Vibrio lentus]PMJ87664.1 pseudouridine synthase [Vibrio lentus]
MTAATKLPLLLQQLEQQMRQCSLWSDVSPSDEALSSVEPFAIDSLQPEEWLQWIFIVKINAMMDAQMSLPKGFAIHPYFGEVWKNEAEKAELLVTILSIDEVCA